MNKKAPNILFIMADQLRRDSIACNGGPVPTPNMDRLASQGANFSNAYCVYPMCTPARAAMLTGRFCHACNDDHGNPYVFNERQLDLDEVTIAKELTRNGYRCSYVGKWHTDKGANRTHVPRGPRRQGHDAVWLGRNCSTERCDPHYFTDDGEKIQLHDKWEADMETEQAVELLRSESKRDTPFYLTVSYTPPHRTYKLPEYKKYLLDQAKKHITHDTVAENIPDRLKQTGYEEAVQYHANVMGIDECLGTLLDEVENLGLTENTIVVFTADHGDNLFAHGVKGKNQFYEECAAVPFIIRFPEKVKENVKTNAFFNLTDLAPTLLDLAGSPVPERMQGKPFTSLLSGESEEGPHKSAYLEVNHPWYDFRFGQGPGGNKRCLVTEDWKLVLIESKAGTGGAIPWQLYERKKDPYELNNLAEDPGCMPIICELMREMWKWMTETEDDFIEHTMSGFRDLYGYLPELP